MKPRHRFVIGAAAAIVAGFWRCSRSPEPTILVDVGIGGDVDGWKLGDPQIWEPSHPVHKADSAATAMTP